MLGKPTIQKLDQELERDLKKELRDQGHFLTGRLERSINPSFVEAANSVALEITAEDYIDDLETGIPASQIDISDGSYMRGLIEYVKLRFNTKNDKQATRIAFKIAAKHEREGMPTRSSYQYSSTGERTHAIETSYHEHQDQYDKIIDNSFSHELEQLIDKTFDQTIF